MEISCCYALRSIAAYAPDVLKKFGSQAAPVAFLASQDDPSPGEQTPSQLSDADGLKPIWEEVLVELTLSKWIKIY